jgi:hypothetical protein
MNKPCKKLHGICCNSCRQRDGSFTTATVHITYSDNSCSTYCYSTPLGPLIEVCGVTFGSSSIIQVESMLAYLMGYQGEVDGMLEIPPDHRWQILNEQ